MLRLLVGMVLLGAFSFGSAQVTLAGSTLAQKIAGLDKTEVENLIDAYFGVGAPYTAGPHDFDVLSYDGNWSMTNASSLLGYILSETESGFVSSKNVFNQQRQPKQYQPVSQDGLWHKTAECLRKNDGVTTLGWYSYTGSSVSGYGWQVGDVATSGTPTNFAYSSWGADWDYMNGGDAWTANCVPIATDVSWYYGDGLTIEEHKDVLQGEFRRAAGGWIARYGETGGVYTVPPGVSHLPDLDAQTASAPANGGGGGGDNTDPTTTTDPTDPDDPDEPTDPDTACSIIDIPCNLRKLFIPQEEWGQKFGEATQEGHDKFPFAFVSAFVYSGDSICDYGQTVAVDPNVNQNEGGPTPGGCPGGLAFQSPAMDFDFRGTQVVSIPQVRLELEDTAAGSLLHTWVRPILWWGFVAAFFMSVIRGLLEKQQTDVEASR